MLCAHKTCKSTQRNQLVPLPSVEGTSARNINQEKVAFKSLLISLILSPLLHRRTAASLKSIEYDLYDIVSVLFLISLVLFLFVFSMLRGNDSTLANFTITMFKENKIELIAHGRLTGSYFRLIAQWAINWGGD